MSVSRAAALALLASLAAAAGPAGAAETIEGTWNYGSGQVLVEPDGAGAFKGTVISAVTFPAPDGVAPCTHPVGQRIWSLTGTGTHFTGTHVWFAPGGCDPSPGGQATWDITSTDPAAFTLRFCTAPPGSGPVALDATGAPIPPTACDELTRAKPPAPAPTVGQLAQLPPAHRCLSRRHFRIHLRRPDGVPLQSAQVKVNGRTVKTVSGARLTAPVDLRGLPKGRYTVAITETTITGTVYHGQRRYRTCTPRHRSR
jgi:hypothetical protein